uniref:Protein CASC3 n=1 Tax=Plectus sambesii TaxID=2011161 RepID=A0A914UVR9_9BILA
MSDDNSAATDNTGANSDEFHSADEADGATRPAKADGGSGSHRRDRASSSSSGSDSEPEADRAKMPSSEASAQQSSGDHSSSQPEAMQGESAIASAAPPSEPDEQEKSNDSKESKDANDAKSESSATEADRSPSVVVDSTSADSTERVSDPPAHVSEEPPAATESTPQEHLTESAPTAEASTQEDKIEKLADTEGVENALKNCSLTESEGNVNAVHVEPSLATENGVHIETAGDEAEAVDGDGHIQHCDEGPSILELSSKDDPRVSPRPPHEQQDNAHVMELDDDGQYDDDDDDDEDDENDASGEDEAAPDDDEDVRNPAFIPKVGRFYMHDRRVYDDEEEEEDKQMESRPGRADAVDKWQHDRFEERSQRPKENTELMHRYGHDIRSNDKPPEGEFPVRSDNRRARGGAPRGFRGRPGPGAGPGPGRPRGSSSGHPQQRRGG